MLRSVVKPFFLFVFFLCFAQSAWADKVLLKNGNVLEGRIVEEKKEFIVLEFNLENGSGNTTILNSQIKSIEKVVTEDLKKERTAAVPKQEEIAPSPKRQQDLEEEYRRIILAVSLIPAGLFIFSFVSLFLMSKLFKAEFSRPLGIKLACFYLNTATMLFTLLGLMFFSLAANRVIFDLKGIRLLIFNIFALGAPVLLFALTTGLFYLKNWARILAIALFVIGLLMNGASFISKSDFIGNFLQGFYHNASEQFSKGGLNLPKNPEGLLSFNLNVSFVFVLFSLLCILYLFRRETKKAFLDAAQFKKPATISRQGLILCIIFALITFFAGSRIYQEGWKNFFHNPYLFTRPAKVSKVIKSDDSILNGFTEYQALGHRFYLPTGMERKSSPAAESKIPAAVFIERNKNIGFIISKMSEAEYRVTIASFYARWNPLLILLKPRSISEKLFSLEMLKFKDREGIMERGTTNGVNDYRFTFRTDKSEYMQCAFMVKDKINSFDEQKILSVIATIR